MERETTIPHNQSIELYQITKFYKGESSCPYNEQTQSDLCMFWFYEQKFEKDFYQANCYPGLSVELAFSQYLSKLFPALADKYGSMDDGTWFQDLYNRLDPAIVTQAPPLKYYRQGETCPFEYGTPEHYFWHGEKEYLETQRETWILEAAKYKSCHPENQDPILQLALKLYLEAMLEKWMPHRLSFMESY